MLPQQEWMQQLGLQLTPWLAVAGARCQAASPCLSLQQLLQEQQQLPVSSWAAE